MKFEIGQRVEEDYLGKGTITKSIQSDLSSKLTIAYMVHFDKTPDVRYNMGTNPCFVFATDLKESNE